MSDHKCAEPRPVKANARFIPASDECLSERQQPGLDGEALLRGGNDVIWSRAGDVDRGQHLAVRYEVTAQLVMD